MCVAAREPPSSRNYNRKQQEYAEQLDADGGVTCGLRHGVGAPDHLGYIVNGRAQHDSCGAFVKSQERTERRIEYHGSCRQRIERNNHEDDVGFLAFVVGQDRRSRECRRSPTHSGTDTDELTISRALPQQQCTLKGYHDVEILTYPHFAV